MQEENRKEEKVVRYEIRVAHRFLWSICSPVQELFSEFAFFPLCAWSEGL